MLYEVQTREARAGVLPELVARIAAALPERERFSPLAAAWQSEIGALNRCLTVWAYADLAERERVRVAAEAAGVWPPDLGDLLAAEQIELVTPAPFMRPLAPAESRGVLEMRTYTFQPGTLPRVVELWARALPERERLSPLIACWWPAIGRLHRFTHVWRYDSLEERARVRAEAVRQGIWPPPTMGWRTAAESSILLPVPLPEGLGTLG